MRSVRLKRRSSLSLYCFTEYTPRNTWLTWLGYVTKTHCAHVHHEIEAPVFPPFAMCVHLLFPLSIHIRTLTTHTHALHTHTRDVHSHCLQLIFCPITSRTACPRLALRRRYPASSLSLSLSCKQFVCIRPSEFRKQRPFDHRKNLFTSLIAWLAMQTNPRMSTRNIDFAFSLSPFIFVRI